MTEAEARITKRNLESYQDYRTLLDKQKKYTREIRLKLSDMGETHGTSDGPRVQPTPVDTRINTLIDMESESLQMENQIKRKLKNIENFCQVIDGGEFFHMRYIQGIPVDQIAKQLGVSQAGASKWFERKLYSTEERMVF